MRGGCVFMCVCVGMCISVSTPASLCISVLVRLFFEVWVSEFTICNAQLILSACIYRGIEHVSKWAWLCHTLLLHPLQRHRHSPLEDPFAEHG